MLDEFLGPLLALSLGVFPALAILLFWLHRVSPLYTNARTLMREAEGSITFLFEDSCLVDATPRARDLFEKSGDDRSDWERFLSLLSARFPHLRSQLSDLATAGHKIISPEDDDAGWIDAEYWHGLARISLVQDADRPDQTIDPLTASAMEHELKTLRSIGEDAPQLIWKRDAEGVLVWANRAYIDLSEALFPILNSDIRPWPPRDVFSDVQRPAGTTPLISMHRIEFSDGSLPAFYEVTGIQRGTDAIYFAVDATAVVNARDAQHNFVQTLTKTFAQLSVGLAIFDADRRLILFNPAIVDLTDLPPDFLISKPTLFAFLDRLRDQQMMPEPRDYPTWRDQMVDLESAAEQGNYHETWSLPNGQTFKVTGKPHPDRAIAFLIEDISAEVSLTRRFRSQIDISDSVLNNLSTAIAVFSQGGSLILANTAYRTLWGSGLEGLLANRDFDEELGIWQRMTSPSPVWIKLSDAINQGTHPAPWSDSIKLDEMITLICRYAPLPDGLHQVTFDQVPQTNTRHTESEDAEISLSRERLG